MMGINVEQLTKYVIRPSLEDIGLWSLEAEQLLLGTAAQESKMGYYLHQVGGPALGVFQMEESTHTDIWTNFLAYKPELYAYVNDTVLWTIAETMVYDLQYATIMARIHYLRVPEALPEAGDLYSQALYWKTYYNTSAGKGITSDYVDNYKRYVK